jgi:hypothetical protein
VQEPPEVALVVGVGVERLEAVDHKDRRPVLLDQLTDPLQDPPEPLGAQQLPQILVEHPPADHAGIEEGHGLAVAQDLLQRLRNSRQVDGGSLDAGIVEHVLLRQDRLAAARRPHHQVDPIGWEPAAQDGVQSLGAAAEPPTDGGVLRSAGGHAGLP